MPQFSAFFILWAAGLLAGPQTAMAAECILKPHSIARLGVASKGIISDIAVERGERVRQGQVLVRLEASHEENLERLARLKAESAIADELARKRAAVAASKADRLIKLGEKAITSKGDVEVAILEAEAARLEIEQADLNRAIAREEMIGAAAALERKTVRAPFDGVITQRLHSSGELYNEQEPILVVARTDPLYAETYLPVADLARVVVGAGTLLTLDTGDTIPATISVVDPVLDPATGTFGIRLEVANPDHTIIAGQRCRVDFDG